MKFKPVTIAAYKYDYQAELPQAALDAAGIHSFISYKKGDKSRSASNGEESIPGIDNNELNQALNEYTDLPAGVKLQVDKKDVVRAKKVLSNLKQIPGNISSTRSKTICPICGYDGIYPERPIITILGLPNFFIRKRNHCYNCGFFWSRHKPASRRQIDKYIASIKKKIVLQKKTHQKLYGRK